MVHKNTDTERKIPKWTGKDMKNDRNRSKRTQKMTGTHVEYYGPWFSIYVPAKLKNSSDSH